MGEDRLFWKESVILLVASVLSIIAVIPYTLTLESGLLEKVQLPMPLWELLILQMAENTLLFALIIIAGLYMARQVGLGLPLLEAALKGESIGKDAVRDLAIAAAVGAVAAVLVAGADVIFIRSGVKIDAPNAVPPVWQGLLAAFYGGIAEEVLTRLFLVSLLAWIFREIKRFLKRDRSQVGPAEMWLAILISAILFGVAHLPVTSALTSLTPALVLRAILLNGFFGVVMGWLYWEKGLESAMLGHFTGDLILHVLIPIL